MRSFRFPSTRSIPLHEREKTSGTQGIHSETGNCVSARHVFCKRLGEISLYVSKKWLSIGTWSRGIACTVAMETKQQHKPRSDVITMIKEQRTGKGTRGGRERKELNTRKKKLEEDADKGGGQAVKVWGQTWQPVRPAEKFLTRADKNTRAWSFYGWITLSARWITVQQMV